MERGADKALCIGAGRAAGLGARPRAGSILTFIFGATTVGSAVWGKLSAMEGLPIAYFVAAAGLALGILLTWPWKLRTGRRNRFLPCDALAHPRHAKGRE